MECDICARAFTGKTSPTCISCVQATLYDSRLAHASALLEREKYRLHAEAIVRPGNDGVIAALPEDADLELLTSGVKSHTVDRWRADRVAINDRIAGIVDKAESLRKEIAQYKDHMVRGKERQAQRREELAVKRKSLERQRLKATDPMRSIIRKTSRKLESLHHRTIDSRALLCLEIALLSRIDKREDADGTMHVLLGGVPIPNLRHLNRSMSLGREASSARSRSASSPHEIVSASLANVCRLLAICAHYLGIRLPAELVLPHNHHPHSRVLTEKSSYGLIVDSNSRTPASQQSSPGGSRILDGSAVPVSRQRLLHLDRSLAQLYKEDPKAFNIFVEAVMLLAWDIAWLCKTQGFDVDTFDDVCNIGRNIYRLFRDQSSGQHSAESKPTSTSGRERESNGKHSRGTAHLGTFSHESAYAPLSSNAGVELLKGWRLSSPARLIDKLKSCLVNEISGAEWDFLSGEEWDEQRDDDAAVIVGAKSTPRDKDSPVMSVMTVPSDLRSQDDASNDDKGKRGWTKVRGRPDV